MIHDALDDHRFRPPGLTPAWDIHYPGLLPRRFWTAFALLPALCCRARMSFTSGARAQEEMSKSCRSPATGVGRVRSHANFNCRP